MAETVPYRKLSVEELPTIGDLLHTPTEQFPQDVQSEADRIRNAYYYARNLGVSTDEAYDVEPQINEAMFGKGTTSAKAWGLLRMRTLGAQRKGLWDAVQHGTAASREHAAQFVTGLGRALAETKGIQGGILDPALRWMLDVPKDVNIDTYLSELSTAVQEDIQQTRAEHPEMGYAIDQDAGFAETLWQMVSRPENVIQGLVEAVPMMVEGYLGGVPGMAIPIIGETYQRARSEGTAVLPSLVESIGTGGIEAAIENWTLNKKIGLAKNFRRMMEDGRTRKIMWEGTKAFFRGSAEEGSQQFNQNFWRWLLTDRSQRWSEGIAQSAAMGGPLEAVMSGGFAGIGRIGTPVPPKEANRRLDIIRRSVQAAELTAEQRKEILAELDKAEEVVPEIILGPEAAAELKKEEGKGAAKAEPQDLISKIKPAEASPKAPIEAPGKGGEAEAVQAEEETPEEAKAAEVKLEAEAAEPVKPRLYIANVTARMKRAWAEAFTEATGKQVEPEDVRPHMEGAFPTKRTAIELTRGEAEDYLGWLETDLKKRLDENLIQTRVDMARAKRDWGDIKELRRVLGMEVGQQPFRVVYAATEQTIVRDESQIKEAYRELERLRKEHKTAQDSALTLRADELADQIIAQEEVIDKMERASGKAVKIIKDTSSAIYAAVQPSTVDESKMTVQEVLQAVLKRSARYAKMAYAAGRRELRADLRAKRRAKKRLADALRRIKQKVPTTTDFFYREAIAALRSNFDLRFRSKREQARVRSTKEFLERIPESEKDKIPQYVFEKITKKPLNDFTIEEIERVADEVDKLIEQGRLKRRLVMRPILEQRAKDKEAALANIEAAPEAKPKSKKLTSEGGVVSTVFDKGRIETWTPNRVFDWLDGAKGTFSGAWHRIFYDGVKQAKDVARVAIREHRSGFNNARKQFGISLRDLCRKQEITVNGEQRTVSTQELMGIYMSSLNPLNKTHLVYGWQFTDAEIRNATDQLTRQEKDLADWMLSWYEQNYSRLRRSVIEQENRDMGKEQNYSPIAPTDMTWRGLQDEMRLAVDQRLQLRAHNVAHGMTMDRAKVPDWMRSKIRLDAVNLWNDAVQKQERYINLGPQIRRMNKVRGDTRIRKVMRDKFGDEILKFIDGYVGTVANPYIYRQYSLPERISAKLRQNTAIAYLGVNLTTMARQPAAILFYLQDAGPAHLAASLMEFTADPMGMMRRVRALDPEVAELSLEREFEEIKGGTNSSLIKREVADFALQGIYLFDQIPRTIGWNAVYQKAIAEGASEAEAVRQAKNSTLRTQNAAEPEDLPAIYRRSEFLNWFLIFTNQPSKIWGVATYDVPTYFKNEQYAKAVLGTVALSLNALLMWMISNRKLPDKPEEWGEVLSDQALELLPLIGKPILDKSEGWNIDIPALKPLQAPAEALKFVKQGIEKDKWELTRSEIEKIAEGLAVSIGLPYTGPKRVIQAIDEGQPGALIGQPRPKKKKRGIP